MSLVVVGQYGGEMFLKPVRGVRGGWDVQKGWKGLIRHEDALSGAESAAFCLGRSRVRGSMLFWGCRRVFYQP